MNAMNAVTEAHKTEIENIKTQIAQALKPKMIYLFGSYANGTFTMDSDMDFYIVVEDDAKNMANLTALAYKSIRHVKRHPVDIVVGTKSRFEYRKNIPSLENEVHEKGVVLYGG